jgi:hypothetical protein
MSLTDTPFACQYKGRCLPIQLRETDYYSIVETWGLKLSSDLMFLVCCPPGCYNLAKGITFSRRRMAQKKAAKKAGKNARKKGAEYLRKGPKK